MAFRSFTGNNWAFMADVETISYTPKHPEQPAVSVAGARFRPVADPSEFTSQGITVTQDMLLCVLPEVNLVDADDEPIEPRNGDLITAGATSIQAGDWMVTDTGASPATFKGRYKLLVTKART